MKNLFISFAIGLAAGSFGGLIGLGGGLIMIPLMISVLKLSQHQAHGTSLVALIFTGVSGALIYGLQGNINLLAVATLSLTAILTARAGAYFANTLPGWKLRRAFGAFLIFCAMLLVIKPYLPVAYGQHPVYVNVIIFLITGVITGFLSGMMGVGGGTIMVPAMVLLAGFGQHMAQGTSLMVMVPVGIAGALAHHQLGNVARGYLPGLIPGIILGVFLGGGIANFIPDTPLRLAFIAAIVMMGVRYVRAAAPE
jgi:hypothetical protein